VRSSYRLYSRGVDRARTPETGRRKHYVNLTARLFWAIVECLSPARRVLLLSALAFFIADIWTHPAPRPLWFGAAFWSVLLLLCLLLLEVGDRVVMKRDLEIAKEIQAWLLPPNPPPIPNLEIAFVTHPANTVAGDYYDVFSRPAAGEEESFLIVVADVAGKSIPAAMLMATFQASLKTLASSPGPLTELLARMNTYACSNSHSGRRFTTAFIGEYAPRSRTLTYVNAGHNPPMLRRRTGELDRLEAGGIPLGILAEASYESQTVTLQPDDWLVIFTDGVTEAENSRAAEYGEARLQAVLNANLTATPSKLLQAIWRDLNSYCGNTPQHDDVTLLLVKAS
jgi:sigma-B regulation protein RsbU (phosphoserine phosphatase)